MLLRPIIAVLALVGLWLAMRWLAKAPPARVKQALIAAALALLVAGGIALVATGRMAGLIAVVAGLAPWVTRVMRLHGVWRALRRFSRGPPPPPGETPPPPPPSSGEMTREQAHEVLGLLPGATADQIREAHRRLMQANHPDTGGSTWIAARLNQARDLLLGT